MSIYYWKNYLKNIPVQFRAGNKKSYKDTNLYCTNIVVNICQSNKTNNHRKLKKKCVPIIQNLKLKRIHFHQAACSLLNKNTMMTKIWKIILYYI